MRPFPLELQANYNWSLLLHFILCFVLSFFFNLASGLIKAVNMTAAASLKEDEMEVRQRGFYFQGTSSELLIGYLALTMMRRQQNNYCNYF